MSQKKPESEQGVEAETSAPKAKVSRRPASHRGMGWTMVHLFGSLKLAMFLFAVIIVASAIGTIEESRFDARVAQHKIYNAGWFTAWLVVLCLNLAGAAFTRWPWKKRHTGFIVTHAGIIILLIGSIIGKHAGIEGSMTLNVGQEAKRHLFLAEMAIQFGDPATSQVYRGSFPLDLAPPREGRPRYYPVPGYQARSAGAPFSRLATRFFNRPPKEPTMAFDRFTDRLVESQSIVAASGSLAQAVRLEMRSSLMGDGPVEVELITDPVSESIYDLAGLAQITLGNRIVRSFDVMERPSPLMQLRAGPDGTVDYHIINSRGEVRQGLLVVGEPVATGWADWTVTLREVLPEAILETVVDEDVRSRAGSGLTGVRGWLDWGDGRRTESRWFVAGDSHLVRLDDEQVRFAFGYRREPIPFKVELVNFEVPRDPGTDTPANFTSYLRFTDLATGKTAEDSCGMNTPAVFPTGFHRLVTGHTFKFSQASWNPDDLSESTVQVLRDPGWLFKWLGSLIIVVGIYLIFFSRSHRSRRPEDIIDEIEPGGDLSVPKKSKLV